MTNREQAEVKRKWEEREKKGDKRIGKRKKVERDNMTSFPIVLIGSIKVQLRVKWEVTLHDEWVCVVVVGVVVVVVVVVVVEVVVVL